MVDSAGSQTIGIFTDTYDQINGVATTYQKLASFCSETSRRLDLFTYGDRDSIEVLGTVRIIRSRPLFPIAYYHDLSFDCCCPRHRILEFCQRAPCSLLQTANKDNGPLPGTHCRREISL
jgi:hypothetical protein